jgi:hypothetical protein
MTVTIVVASGAVSMPALTSHYVSRFSGSSRPMRVHAIGGP